MGEAGARLDWRAERRRLSRGGGRRRRRRRAELPGAAAPHPPRPEWCIAHAGGVAGARGGSGAWSEEGGARPCPPAVPLSLPAGQGGAACPTGTLGGHGEARGCQGHPGPQPRKRWRGLWASGGPQARPRAPKARSRSLGARTCASLLPGAPPQAAQREPCSRPAGWLDVRTLPNGWRPQGGCCRTAPGLPVYRLLRSSRVVWPQQAPLVQAPQAAIALVSRLNWRPASCPAALALRCSRAPPCSPSRVLARDSRDGRLQQAHSSSSSTGPASQQPP